MAQKILKRGRMGMAAYKQFSSLSPTVPPLVISVEGNIGVGKSTLLLKLENILGKRLVY
jgi:predicted ATP-dependent serine protease